LLFAGVNGYNRITDYDVLLVKESKRMDIKAATKDYEEWAGKHIPLIPEDIESKHAQMTESVFSFFRATYYRWVQVWAAICVDETNAPIDLCIGDIHIDNFGTWRDAEGRLTWGVNDFDEAYPLPYTIDLIRLTTSAILGAKENKLAINAEHAASAVLEGYTESITNGGKAFILAEDNAELRAIASSQAGDPTRFWKKLSSLEAPGEPVSESVKALLAQALPENSSDVRIVHRQSGLGSLGHKRYVALAKWRDGLIAREAKELSPSASVWLEKLQIEPEPYYKTIMERAVRNADPYVSLHEQWLLRRLSPDCRRVELEQLSKERDEELLLHAMGFEIGNIHLGSKHFGELIHADLRKRPARWLLKAGKAMAESFYSDWVAWRKG
jgi:hypothetical protein